MVEIMDVVLAVTVAVGAVYFLEIMNDGDE